MTFCMAMMARGGVVSDSPRLVLVDSDVWVGYYIENDALHQKAASGLERLESSNFVPVISSQIIGEVATVLSHKSGTSLMTTFLDDIEGSEMTIIYLNKAIHQTAIDIMYDTQTKGVSYGDCVNIATLQETGIDAIYAYDKFYHKRFGLDNVAYPKNDPIGSSERESAI